MTVTTPEDICNRALGEIGARTLIVDLTDDTPAARYCNLYYNVVRRELLRTAPWGFARKTLALTVLGLATDTPPASIYPWASKYAYPGDCIAVRYVLPPPPGENNLAPLVGSQVAPWCGPSRAWRFLPAYDDTLHPPAKVIVSNVLNAIAVYIADVTDPTLMDVGFKDAFVALLANKLVLPLSGNVKMKSFFMDAAKQRVIEARAQDGNEAITTSDHIPDWMAVRGSGAITAAAPGFDLGYWYQGFVDLNWGM